MIDQHFSPPELADRVASLVECDPGTVFDPAMGEGALLKAIGQRWPEAHLLGADLDASVVNRARSENTLWTVSQGDALNPRSRRTSSAWRTVRAEGVDYVVMNPPFSFRGFGGPTLDLEGVVHRPTPAMAFLISALVEARPRRGAIAILPQGTLKGERDRALQEWLTRAWTLEVVEELPRGTFPGVSASTVLVRVRPGDSRTIAPLDVLPPRTPRSPRVCVCVDLIRGRVPVARRRLPARASEAVKWAHTTTLRNNMNISDELSDRVDQATLGPLVLLPRVGRFDPKKVAILGPEPIVLSDCLYALRPRSGDAASLAGAILDHHWRLSDFFLGTGAPHMTISRLTEFAAELGYVARHVPASSGLLPCSCGFSDVLGDARELRPTG